MVKETKLYDLLGISPSAAEPEIKKGYKKAALKYHPDKPTGDEEKFKEISEAYDILSSEEKREIYDTYGLDAARGNAPAGGGPNPFAGGAGGAGGPGGFHFSSSGGGHPFSSNDAFNIFEQFSSNGGFGGDDPFSHMFGGMGGGGMGGGSPFGGMGGGSSGFSQRRGPPRAEPTVVTLNLKLTLEELFTGATKKMKLSRKGPTGIKEDKILEINVRPGWKAGTKITFAGEGDYQSDGQRQTIQFVIEEKAHPVFKRDGNDLKCALPLSFKESLLGFDKEVQTIDGRRISISKSQPVQPNQTLSYPGLGMPLSKSPSQRGNLEISFKVDYPLTLSPTQKAAIAQAF